MRKYILKLKLTQNLFYLGMNAVYSFQVTDATPSEWYIDLKNGAGALASGQFSGKF